MGLPIVVTHPSSLFHNGLRNLLAKSRFRPVRIATSLSEDLEEYLRSQPNCVWLTGVERSLSITTALVRKVTATNSGVKVVILAASQEPEEIIAALKAGACGFLSQDTPAERLLRSLELIALGEMIVHPHVAWRQTANDKRPDLRESEFALAKSAGAQPIQRFEARYALPTMPVDEGGQTQGDDVVPSLSRREMLILRMLMQGASNKAIARNLVITESTVKVHMKAILRKLRLQNRTQAAIWARNHVNEGDGNQRTANGGPAH
jgi:two-component system nitrate/nitrite response regulator NarL